MIGLYTYMVEYSYEPGTVIHKNQITVPNSQFSLKFIKYILSKKVNNTQTLTPTIHNVIRLN